MRLNIPIIPDDDVARLIFEAVCDDPLNLAARAALADACEEAGQWEYAEFWGFTIRQTWLELYWMKPDGMFGGWLWRLKDGGMRFWGCMPECPWYPDTTTEHAFARLRIGWDRARKEGLV